MYTDELKIFIKLLKANSLVWNYKRHVWDKVYEKRKFMGNVSRDQEDMWLLQKAIY